MANNNGENISENIETSKKEKKIDIKSQFTKEYTKSFLAGKDRNRFIDDIMKYDNINDSEILKRKFKVFKLNSTNLDFRKFDESKISIYDLRKLAGKEYFKLENSRKNYLENTFNNYSLSDKQKTEIEKNVRSKTDKELSDLIKYNSKNKTFLESILNETIIQKDAFDFFDKISEAEKTNRYNKLSELQKRDFQEIILNIKNGRILDVDFRNLFSMNYFKESEKKEFLSIYMPYISLEEAVILGIYTNNDAEKRKKDILKELFSEKNIETDIIKSVNLSDVRIKTSDLKLNNDGLNLLSESIGFSNLEEDTKKALESGKEELKKNGPQDLEELKEKLKNKNKDGKYNHLEKFSDLSIMKISKKNKDNKEEISYVKILKTDDDKKEIKFLNIGNNIENGKEIINLKTSGEGEYISYADFFNNFDESKSELDFFSIEEIKDKINNPNDNLDASDLLLINDDDLKDKEKKDKYKSEYKDKLKRDLEELNKELEEKNEFINDDTKNKSDFRGRPNLESLIDFKEKELQEIDDNELADEKLLYFMNINKLTEKLDLINPEGSKLGLKKGLIIKTKEWAYEIDGIDEESQEIILKTNAGTEPLSFDGFYQAFKEKKAERIEKISNFDDLLKSFQKEDESNWGGHEFKDGKLIAKDVENGDEKGDKEVEFFVSEKENMIIKINNISGNEVTVQFGERKNISDLDKKDKNYKKDDKGEILYIEGADKVTLSLDELQKLLSDEKYKFKPSWQTGKEIKEKQSKDLQNKFEGHPVTRYFDRYSILELKAGGKMFFEGFTEALKRGHDVHAAKVALKIGSILPEEIRAELQIKVDSAEKDSMEKALEGLGKVESKIAINRIKEWLHNKDTPEHKKEAGLMFMISKYGLLYAKGPMAPYKGKFLWYEAFGGRVNDSLYLEEKQKAKDANIPFTEERLMYAFLNRQCTWEGGYNGIKRRGRLYKDYDGKISQGITDEMEKGTREADAMRNFADRNNAAIGEIRGGEFNNGIGKYISAVNRGSDLHNLNELPFILLFSGVGYLFQEEQLNKFKDFSEGMKFGGLLFTKFLSDINGMKVFNDTILKLSEEFENKDSQFKGMKDEADKIFKNIDNSEYSIGSKMDKAQEFWKKYGEALTNSMLKLNNKGSKYIKTNKILLGEKDKFSNYNSTLDGYLSAAKFNDEGIMGDQFNKQGVSGLDAKVFEEIGTLTPEGTFKNGESAFNIWNEIVGEINSIKYNNGSVDENTNLINMEEQLSFIFTYIKKREGQKNIIGTFRDGTGDMGLDLKKLGINNYIDDLQDFSSDELSKLNTGKVKKFIRDIAKDVISGKLGVNTSSIDNFSTPSELTSTQENIKTKTEEIIPDENE